MKSLLKTVFIEDSQTHAETRFRMLWQLENDATLKQRQTDELRTGERVCANTQCADILSLAKKEFVSRNKKLENNLT